MINYIISKIKNSILLKKLFLEIFLNKFEFKIIYNLYKFGFINGLLLLNNIKYIIYFKYINNKNIIRNLKQISKKGKRLYINILDFNKLKNNYFKKLNGFLLITTSKGLVFDEFINLKNIGGEVILKIN
jgi:ribosomal protein S8